MDLLNAQTEAAAGRFSQAEQLSRKALPKCPVELEEQVLEMIEGFKASRPFVQPSSAPSLYLKFENPIPFFQNVEDLLDEWNNTY